MTERLEGWLTLTKASPAYSGNYSCVPSYTTPDWVLVHVIKGDAILDASYNTGCCRGLGSQPARPQLPGRVLAHQAVQVNGTASLYVFFGFFMIFA